jgi:hypothetical protein
MTIRPKDRKLAELILLSLETAIGSRLDGAILENRRDALALADA